MDFDADGLLDLVSGSYDPGEIYLFRGRQGGKFADRETIKDRDGRPILKAPEQKEKVESFGSWMAMVDWDDDGDLDILVGTFDGMIFLRRNEGTRADPRYASKAEWVKVGDKVLRVPGGEHANPVVADWDGDGLWDLVTGAADGGVYWYRNAGKRGRPEFEAPVILVEKHDGIGYGEVFSEAALKPGIRSQIAVADHDGDGKLDVLLGDFGTYLHLKKDLTPDQKKAFDEVARKQDVAVKLLRAAMDTTREKFKERMKGVPPSEWNTPENSAKWLAAYNAMKEAPDYKKNNEEYERTDKEMMGYIDRNVTGRKVGADAAVAHGFVWLFRRN